MESRSRRYIPMVLVNPWHRHRTISLSEIAEFLENGAEGIYLKGIFGSGLVENNIIGDRGHNKFGWDGVGFGDAYNGDGIDLGGGPNNASKNITVRGNTIVNIRGNGIIAVAGNVTIEGNIIEDPNSWNKPAHKACIVVRSTVSGTHSCAT